MQDQPPLLSNEEQLPLESPDMEEMRSQRMLRNQKLMNSVASGMTIHPMTEGRKTLEGEELAAVNIQRMVRGFLSRRRYVALLFAKFEEEEKQRMERTLRQCREGELLVKNRQLWKEMDDDVTVRRNRRLRQNSAAITIQRAWREHLAMSTSTSPSSSTPSLPKEPHEEEKEEEEVASIVSDYSELTAHVRAHFAATGGRVVRREDLRVGNTILPDDVDKEEEEETEEGRAKRLRKHNLLSLAVEFAQLKQVDETALPFDLHRLAADEEEEEEDEEEQTAVPMEEGSSDEPPLDNSDDDDDEEEEEECELRPVPFSVLGEPERSTSEEREPNVDWEAFTADLRHAQELQQQEEEENLRQAYRLERARVLESLTTAGQEPNASPCRILRHESNSGDLEEDEDETWRRHPGRFGTAAAANRITELTKPMQLCFINDVSSDEDFASDSIPGSAPRRPPASLALGQNQSAIERTDGVDSLLRKQSQLHAEAKLALAQAQPMAKMQLEVEKDALSVPIVRHVVEKVGGQGRQLTQNLLSAVNVEELRKLVTDFRDQIEELNRRLMDLLLERDDLHMEQDSKLLDVEDLTRRAQEIATKLQEEKQKQSQASPARNGKDRRGSAASRAQAKARSTTRAVTSRLAAFFKSSNQSVVAGTSS